MTKISFGTLQAENQALSRQLHEERAGRARAERAERDITTDRDHWRRRAQAAEATVSSMGDSDERS